MNTTDTIGTATFSEVRTGMYDYTITLDGYENGSGTVTITDADVSETVSLTTIPNDTTMILNDTATQTDTTVTGIAADVEFQIFPNPAQQSITITGAAGLEVAFYDLTGRHVKYIPHLQENTQVNLSGWATGIYTVRVGNRTKKLIVR